MLQAILTYVSIVVLYLLSRKFTRIPQYYFLIGLMIASLVIYFPGVDQDDVGFLYQNFITGQYNDWQPPLYTIWWHVFHVKSAVFFANILTYYAGLIYISKHLSDRKCNWQNDLLVIFSFYPLYATQLIILLKDVQYTGFIILIVAMLFALQEGANRWKRAIISTIILVAIFFMIGIKYNGLFAAYPLAVYFIYLWLSSNGKIQLTNFLKWFVAATFAVILLIGFVVANNLIVTHIFNAVKSRSSVLVMYNDLINIQCSSGQQIIPESWFVSPDRQEIMCDPFFINYSNYEPQTVSNWSGANNPALFDYSIDNKMTDQQYNNIRNVWLDTVVSHPVIYLEYRTKFITNIIFHQWWWTPISVNPGVLQQHIATVAVGERQSLNLVNGLFIIIGNLVVGLLCLWRRNKLATVVICSSWLQLVSVYLLLGVPAARFFMWNYLAVIMGVVLLFSGVIEQEIMPDKSKLIRDNKLRKKK